MREEILFQLFFLCQKINPPLRLCSKQSKRSEIGPDRLRDSFWPTFKKKKKNSYGNNIKTQYRKETHKKIKTYVHCLKIISQE